MKRVVILLAFFVAFSFGANSVFNVDLTKKFPWNHYWEECVGSGHALLSLRQDWREHLRQVHDELGFKMVRFHGLFDDDMSAILSQNGKNVYSWFNIDTSYDFLLSIGMKPYVELSFMPELIASKLNGSFCYVMHYKGITNLPANPEDWSNLIVAFEKHMVERYGLPEVSSWYQECWNEPNCGFLTGNYSQYLDFFALTSKAVKSVSPSLKIGGPVTCQSDLIPEFLSYVQQKNVAYDFIATHEYPTDPNIPHVRGGLADAVRKTRQLVGGKEFLSYSEYNDGLFDPAFHDTSYAAAFIIHNVALIQGMTDILSWWTFTDIFEEMGQCSQPFFKDEGWGLLNIHQIPKPSYRAFELLHRTGKERYQVTSNVGNQTTLFVLATNVDGHDSNQQIIGVNYNYPGLAVKEETIEIQVVSDIPFHPNIKASIVRIDDVNSNAPNHWKNKMGSPEYPTKQQIEELKKVSKLVHQPIEFKRTSPNTLSFSDIVIPPQSLFSIRIY